MRTCVILHPKTEVTYDRGNIYLRLPDTPGMILPFTMIDTVMRRTANPNCLIFRLREGYVFGPDYPGRDRELSNFLLKSYMYFGREGDRKTVFFIPKPYVLYIDYDE